MPTEPRRTPTDPLNDECGGRIDRCVWAFVGCNCRHCRDGASSFHRVYPCPDCAPDTFARFLATCSPLETHLPDPRRPHELTITLTGAAPVRIDRREWPIVASSDVKTAGERGRALCRLLVRRHADGRAIVYGIDDREKGPSRRGGEMVQPGNDTGVLPTAILRVRSVLSLPRELAERTIASLPAVGA